jgi:hypothetical protein
MPRIQPCTSSAHSLTGRFVVSRSRTAGSNEEALSLNHWFMASIGSIRRDDRRQGGLASSRRLNSSSSQTTARYAVFEKYQRSAGSAYRLAARMIRPGPRSQRTGRSHAVVAGTGRRDGRTRRCSQRRRGTSHRRRRLGPPRPSTARSRSPLRDSMCSWVQHAPSPGGPHPGSCGRTRVRARGLVQRLLVGCPSFGSRPAPTEGSCIKLFVEP